MVEHQIDEVEAFKVGILALIYIKHMGFEAGMRLGRYEIRSLLGAGGMGEVYRAKDPKLDRDVAIKVLSSDFSRNPDRLRRFEQEARAAGALNHPGILSIYDVATHEDIPYVVSELLEGETLRVRLSSQALPTRKAIDYALQIAKALSAAHEKGIVHRDLKPENLFNTKDGRIKILDFGLAKLRAPSAEEDQAQSVLPTQSSLTTPGTVMGTVAYMSPEQVRGGYIDHRTDIFSFGTVLFEMLTGKPPFYGDSSVETMNRILKDEPPDLNQTNLTVPPALERVMRRCLEKNPVERFQSASDLAFALETLSAVSETQAPTHPAERKRRRKLIAWIAASVLFLSLFSAIVLLISRFRQAPPALGSLRFPISIPEGVNFVYDVETHNLTISPDGRRLAFIAASKGQKMLWIRSLDSFSAEPRDGTQGAVSPFWSPDSRSIAFFAEGKLKKIDASGGSMPQTVCSLSSNVEDRIGAWGADGTILFSEAGGSSGIYRISADGGTASLSMKFKSFGFYWIDFLPDGKHFVITGGSDPNEIGGIYVGEVGSSETRMLLPVKSRAEYAAPGFLLYVREGTIVAHPFDAKSLRFTGEPFVVVERLPSFDKTGWTEFSVSETGVLAYLNDLFKTEMVWYDRGGRELNHVGSSSQYFGLRLSPDGDRLAMVISDSLTLSGDIWIHDLKRDARTRFAFGPADDSEPVWSPDGRELAFFSCCEDKSTFHIKGTNDPGKGRLPLQSGFHGPDDWSLDGRFIIYSQGSPLGNRDLWILPFIKGAKPYPFLQTQFNEVSARFSPDVRWVAYVSNESGQDDVYVSRFENPSERWRISTAGGTKPNWRRDGKELFYVSADSKLMVVPIKTGNSFEPGVPTALFRMDTALENDYDVTADGQRFLINRTTPTAQSIPFNVVVNWALPKKPS